MSKQITRQCKENTRFLVDNGFSCTVEERVGFVIGGVPPVVHNEKIETYTKVT